MDFYLGVHLTNWLNDLTVPAFVSHRLLRDRKRLPVAATRWALDSGSFTEIALLGEFVTPPADYARAVARYRDEVGRLDWAAPQDHLCVPSILAGSKVASTVAEAQAFTVDSYLRLRSIDAELPIIPVLQGWEAGDYWQCADRYAAAGVDLEAEPVVGLGSIAGRQATDEVAAIAAGLSTSFRVHGFGVSDGLARYGWCLTSADSMSWSYRGRRIKPCPLRPVVSCGNCRHFALEWRERTLRDCAHRPIQLAFGTT